jgi:lactoylglutathione lyase
MKGIRLTAAALAATALASALSASQVPPGKPQLPPSFGLIFASLQVRDLDRTLGFYQKTFGMRILNTYDGAAQKEQQLVFPDTPAAGGINLIQHAGVGEPIRDAQSVHLVIRVQDIRATCREVEAAGGKIARQPADAAGSGIWVAMLEDPDGHLLELVQY